MGHKLRILFLDIETFPNVAYVWGKYDQNVIEFKQESCLATFAAKWLDEEKVFAYSLPDYSGYRPNSYNDKRLVITLWKMLDEADIVIAHNGDAFDVRVCNARFIHYGLKPPSPFKTVDTKKAVKRVARFNSNALNDLGQTLRMGQKIKTDFSLWKGCIEGDTAAWKRMVDYNKQDVLLLEKLYLHIRPWISNHPNFTAATNGSCPKCNSTNVQYRGYSITNTRRYRRFKCNECGGWGRETKSESGTWVTNG